MFLAFIKKTAILVREQLVE